MLQPAAAAVKAARQQGTSEPTATCGRHSAAADEAISEALRSELEAAAHERLDAAGVPEFLRIRPVIRDVMVRLWLGEAVPVLAMG